MIIQYPSVHKWTKTVTSDPLFGFGKNHTVRINNSLKKISDSSVTHSFEPLTSDILEWFIPLYTATITEKNNPKLNDILKSTLGKVSKFSYFALILREEEVPIGATIFSERNSILSFAYRIYPLDWQKNNLPAGPSLYAEYLMNAYASQNGFSKISHGKDRNPYGYNAGIGLALFKLSVGCAIDLPKDTFEILSLDSTTVTQDILVFAYPENGSTHITEAYLCVSKDTLSKYDSILKYEHLIHTNVILRD
jgi:hypothetical protein